MSSTLARSASRPLLSPRWTSPDAASAQADRSEGMRAARDSADGADALDRFWRSLAADGARDLLRLYGEGARLLEGQSATRERLRHELDTDLVNRAAANQRQHDDRMGALRRESGPESPPYKERAARAEDAQKTLRAVRGEVNSRPLRTQFGPFYYLMMLVLALAEVPVNRAAFELAFREEPVFSLLLAAAVGVTLIFLAHCVGLVLRRWPQRPSFGAVATRVAALAAILGVVGPGIYVMARMRQGFMRLISAESDSFAQRLQEALRGGTTQAAAAAVTTDAPPLTIGDWTFIAINVLFFVAGVVLSFSRHDPHPDYEKAIREGRRADRALAKVEKRYGAKAREEAARYEERKRSLEGQMGELRATLAALADQSSGIQEHCAASRQMVAQTVRKRCATFVDGFGTAAAAAAAAAATAAGAAAGAAPSGRAAPMTPPVETILTELPTPEAVVRAG